MIKHGDQYYPGAVFRMFESSGLDFTELQIKDLLLNTSPSSIDKQTMPAGYTYLGQFIDHDIVRLQRSSKPARKFQINLESLKYLRSPSLDLDSLYGSEEAFGPDVPNLEGKFISNSNKFGKRSGNTLISDLPRKKIDYKYLAEIGDDRNDENLIIAQMHVLFMNAHNILVDHYKSKTPRATVLQSFLSARKTLTVLYQAIIKNDFLDRILNPEVFQRIFKSRTRMPFIIHTSPNMVPSLPVEFIGAAFRFGHSMIRNTYKINNNPKTFTLRRLFELTGRGGLITPYCAHLYNIDWRFFFDLKKYGANSIVSRAEPIEFNFSKHLRNLINEAPNNNDLVFRNIMRGKELGLPSGQDIVAEIRDGESRWSNFNALKDHNFREKLGPLFGLSTPLWIYTLLESDFEYTNTVENSGTRLGVLGSIIVGEVFNHLFHASRVSIYNHSDCEHTEIFFDFLNDLFLDELYEGKKLELKNVKMEDLIAFVDRIED